jgi:hypothetical protein
MDAILYWNQVALEANRVSHTNGRMEQTGPTLSSRALAIVHLAMYDAYAAIDPAAGGPYMPGLPDAPSGATVQAAVGVLPTPLCPRCSRANAPRSMRN